MGEETTMTLMKRRQGYLLTAVLLAIAPLTAWPISPVPDYLELRIDVRRSVDRVIDQLQTAGEDAGLQCVAIPLQAFTYLTYHGGVRCAPGKAADGRFNGSIAANSIEGTKTVTVSVFSIDGIPYQTELHPNIERALQAFKKAMAADANVERFQECVWPETRPCESPLPD
jgi:hypothetical protein